MKKALILCFSVLFANFLVAQQSVSISGPSSVEVGVPYNYTFTFNPQYPFNNATGVQADSYIITEWIVSTGTNGSSSGITGYINTPSNQSSYYYDGTYNNSNPKTIPIQWGDGTFLSSDNITVKVSGIYRKNNTGENIGYFTFLSNTKSVNVERLIAPIINGATNIADCDQTNQTYSYANATNDDSRLWTVTGGATITGSATEKSIIVTPPISGNYDVTCVVKRTGANSNYKTSSAKTTTRIARTLQITTSNSAYACFGLGKVFQTDNLAGITSVAWSAPNCSVSAETILNGKRQVTVTPNATIPGGVPPMTVSATANFNGGCTATNSITMLVGPPRAGMSNATTPSGDYPSSITATADHNYLQFSLTSPLGTYIPSFHDWQYEKISGNFFFNSSTGSGYIATSRDTQVADIYLTGANPTDNPLKFKARVKSECDWGPWTEFIWCDGTTTPPPPPPAVKYFTVSPNPGSYYVNINIINPYNLPPNSIVPIPSFTAVLYYSNGTQCTNPITLVNYSGTIGYTSNGPYGGTLPNGTYFVKIIYGTYSETHAVIKI